MKHKLGFANVTNSASSSPPAEYHLNLHVELALVNMSSVLSSRCIRCLHTADRLDAIVVN